MFSRVRVLLACKEFSYGEQMDYFGHGDCVGWVCFGDERHPEGLPVVMSNSDSGYKTMNVSKNRAGVSLWMRKQEGKHWVTFEESLVEDQGKEG
ncbi:hypothetical protein EDD21DRAFT_414351 [Dissophora ornata]|nr:hypothetical protein EDD21DRAFT_414351 [Dissophora ornata]